MARTRIGLDIGSTAVRAAELTEGDKPSVIRAAQVPLPPDAVENGEVRDVGIVAEALRELWTRGGFKSRRVYMGVKDLPQVRQGLGVSIVSTPRGVMSDAHARAANVGGEVLCTVF